MDANQKERLISFIRDSERIIAFTGAGVSTESGIPDFHSPGGIWNEFRPVLFQEFMSSEKKRVEDWTLHRALYERHRDSKPNAAHEALVELEREGKLIGVITQNVDGLHQTAGSTSQRVLELHGTVREAICLSCGDLRSWEEIYGRLKAGEKAPRCQNCKGILKSNVISYGQTLDPAVLQTAGRWARECDLLLAMGSSLVVEPAASLPLLAKESGARLVIINLSPTPFDDVADLVIAGPVGAVLRDAVQSLREGIG